MESRNANMIETVAEIKNNMQAIMHYAGRIQCLSRLLYNKYIVPDDDAAAEAVDGDAVAPLEVQRSWLHEFIDDIIVLESVEKPVWRALEHLGGESFQLVITQMERMRSVAPHPRLYPEDDEAYNERLEAALRDEELQKRFREYRRFLDWYGAMRGLLSLFKRIQELRGDGTFSVEQRRRYNDALAEQVEYLLQKWYPMVATSVLKLLAKLRLVRHDAIAAHERIE